MCLARSLGRTRVPDAAFYRLRLPNALRKFKLVKETKATLLHEMIHAYLYLTGQIMEGESFNDHSRLFKQHMHRINTDTLVFDAWPRGSGKRFKAEAVESITVQHLYNGVYYTGTLYTTLYRSTIYRGVGV